MPSLPSILPPTLGPGGLSSLWDGLSPHLIASIYEVVKTGDDSWGRTAQSDAATVLAPLTEASMEMVLNWQSPFEQAEIGRASCRERV